MKKIIKREMKRRIKTGTNPLLVAKWLATYTKVQKGLRRS
jgi:hypothetical protein